LDVDFLTTDTAATMRCIHCPTPENLRCAGLDVRRFCELIDPSCPQYDPRYREAIVREGRSAGDDIITLLDLHRHPIDERVRTTARPIDCCGGGVPPGIFDET
jgi:hypothetical protein